VRSGMAAGLCDAHEESTGAQRDDGVSRLQRREPRQLHRAELFVAPDGSPRLVQAVRPIDDSCLVQLVAQLHPKPDAGLFVRIGTSAPIDSCILVDDVRLFLDP
jgi:hypothetical protein